MKNYRKERDLRRHFRDFLAKSYVALAAETRSLRPLPLDLVVAIPGEELGHHATAANARNALLHVENCLRALDVQDSSDGASKLDPELLTRVADKVWLVTLGRRAGKLVMAEEQYVEAVRLIAEKGVTPWGPNFGVRRRA